MNNTTSTPGWTLTREETKSKSAKYIYRVFNEKGELHSQRTSNRKYVACTINGQYYFGRVDLVGKGDHGKQIKYNIANNIEQVPVVYLNPQNV